MVNKAELEQKLKKLAGLSPEAQAKAVKTLFTSEELKFLQQQAMHSKQPGKCIFCAIAKGEIRAKIVYDDAHFSAFLDINPANPGHILVIPKQHYEVLPQIPDELLGAYMKLLKILAAAVFEATQAQGVNIISPRVNPIIKPAKIPGPRGKPNFTFMVFISPAASKLFNFSSSDLVTPERFGT